jgi:hypothetical protein
MILIMRVIMMMVSLLLLSSAYGQDVRDEATKMSSFVSKTGVIIKYEDYNMDGLKTMMSIVDARVRVIRSGGDVGYFLQLTNAGKYDKKTASIEASDLEELRKAIASLKSQATADANNPADYLENKFVTEDGFQLGYFKEGNKLNWYIQLTKYGDGNTVFLRDVFGIEQLIGSALSRIDSLKS